MATTDSKKAYTSLYVETDLWEAAKERAREERRSLAALVMCALEQYIRVPSEVEESRRAA